MAEEADTKYRTIRKARRAHEAAHQGRSMRHTEYLANSGLEPSVAGVGETYQSEQASDAPAETINGHCKPEVIDRCSSWRCRKGVELAARQ